MPATRDMPAPPTMPEPTEVPSSDGVVLATYDSPPRGSDGATGRGIEVLLSHANGFCAAVFAPLVSALAEHRCVSYDARAHGRSTRGSADMAWDGHRDDALAVHDALGMDRPVGVGHSMGGAALLLAEQQRPGTFAALWLFEPIVFPAEVAETGENPMEQGALRRRSHFRGPEEAFANFAGKPPLSELCDECLAAYVTYGFHPARSAHADRNAADVGMAAGNAADLDAGDGSTADGKREAGGITLACRPEDEAAGYRLGPRHSAWDHLGEVQCPVVVLRGRDTSFGPATVAPAIAEAIPNGRLEPHDELGHFGPLADPGAMARSVLDLIATLNHPRVDRPDSR